MPCWLIIVLALSVAPRVAAGERPVELAAGTSALLLLGPVSGESSFSLDLLARGEMVPALWWVGGVRTGLAPLSPELFGRLSAAPRAGVWRPDVGLELGLSRRAHVDTEGALLEESRAVSRERLWPLYLAIHAAPLRFAFAKRYWLSALELQLGTQLAPFGRFVRAQLGLASLGVAL